MIYAATIPTVSMPIIMNAPLAPQVPLKYTCARAMWSLSLLYGRKFTSWLCLLWLELQPISRERLVSLDTQYIKSMFASAQNK